MMTAQSHHAPSDDVLITFAAGMEEIQAAGLAPELAVKDAELRSLVAAAYAQHQKEQEALRIAAEQETARIEAERQRAAEQEAARIAAEQEAARIEAAKIAARAAIEAKLGITAEAKRAKAIGAWVQSFGMGQNVTLPVPRMNADGKHYLCSTSQIVQCCDGKDPVDRFGIIETPKGEDMFYGICRGMVQTFKDATRTRNGLNHQLFRYMDLVGAQRCVKEANECRLVANWFYYFASPSGNSTIEALVERQSGKHDLCCMPASVPCCNKEQPAQRYIAHKAVAYGVCQKAGQILQTCYDKLGRPACLQSTATRDNLDRILDIQARDLDLVDWVDSFVSADDSELEEPRPLLGDGSVHFCGLPEEAGCCDHSQPAQRFASLNGGDVYGVCMNAARAFCEGRERHGDPDCLKVAKTVADAEYYAQQWRLRNSQTVASFGPKAPSAATKAKKLERLKRKQARADADNKARPRPNEGSGRIDNKGNGKKGNK